MAVATEVRTAGKGGREASPAVAGLQVERRRQRDRGLRRIQTTLGLLRLPTVLLAALLVPFIVNAAVLPQVYAVLGFAGVYSLLALLALRIATDRNVAVIAFMVTVLDTITLSGAIALSGGILSELHIAYYAIAIGVSIYFRTTFAVMATTICAVAYAAAVTYAGGSGIWLDVWPVFALRILFLAFASVFVGYMARERFQLTDVNAQLQSEIQRRERAERLIEGMNSAMAVVQEADDEESAVFDRMSTKLAEFGLDVMIATARGNSDRLSFSYNSFATARRSAVAEAAGRDSLEVRELVISHAPELRSLIRGGEPRHAASVEWLLALFEPAFSRAEVAALTRALGDPQAIVAPLVEEQQVAGLVVILGKELFPEDVPVVEAYTNQVETGLRSLERVRQLARLERSKSEFLAMVSHELKTPLTSVKTATELLDELESQAGDGPRTRLVRSIRRGVGSLERMVMELLDFARMQHAELPLDIRNVNLAELIDGVVAEIQPMVREKGQALEVRVSPLIGSVPCDPVRIGQVLANLLSNATKYTPAGGTIVVSADEERRHVVVRVRDTGLGITEQDQPYIFDPFFRGSQARSAALAGSGLGLAIVRSLVMLHGGTIWLTSQVGAGSEFAFSIPLEA